MSITAFSINTIGSCADIRLISDMLIISRCLLRSIIADAGDDFDISGIYIIHSDFHKKVENPSIMVLNTSILYSDDRYKS
jgi:hypothetical protein